MNVAFYKSGRRTRLKRRWKTYSFVLGLAVAGTLAFASSAGAVSVTNACTNSVTANNSQLGSDTSGTSPASVTAGDTFSLTNLQQQISVPGSIFITGYNLGLLQVGVNNIPINIRTVIEGTNTSEGQQSTATVGGSPPNGSLTISTTISDPDGTAGTGDETATDAVGNLAYPDMTWTAGAPNVPIDFREDTVTPLAPNTGGIVVNSLIAGLLNVQFRCSPGTVTPPDPGTVSFIDPAPSFTSTDVTPAVTPTAPAADAGPDQSVASGALVHLDGTGTIDINGDPITYMWTPTSGPPVTLSDPTSATPTFTAPTGPSTLTFDLQACDPGPLCSTDSVTVNVTAPPSQPPAPAPPPVVTTPTTNPACAALTQKIKKARKAGKRAKVRKLKQQLRKLGC